MVKTLRFFMSGLCTLIIGSCSSQPPEAGFLTDLWGEAWQGDTITNDQDAVAEGEFGYPCWSDEECVSGYCAFKDKAGFCTQTCDVALCPEGLVCRTSLEEPKVALCVVPNLALCRPCRDDWDCRSGPADFGDACVKFGDQEGSFCGVACSDDRPCPAGYTCTQDAATLPQCLPDDNTCECSSFAVDQAATTQCFRVNEYGMCHGEIRCLPEGMSSCTARPPAGEVCDGEDNNCDGQVDELLSGGACYSTNEFGTCSGVLQCKDGEGVCDAPVAMAETCDLKDNDCDGLIDEGMPDTDLDGLLDCLDSDDDSDEIPDSQDNCPLVKNPDQADFEGDLVGDLCDSDDDNDGADDSVDNCPFLENAGQEDQDMDGQGDSCDEDIDGDQIPNTQDNCPTAPNESQIDTDGDTQGDVCDDDDDNDGLKDPQDNCPLDYNPQQEDLDLDGVGDICTTDDDGDGAMDGEDNCPTLYNPNQEDSDGDSLGDLCDDDRDNDGIANPADNCPLVKNPDQADSDHDLIGDACDGDGDGDGVADAIDNCLDVQNPTQSDADGDLEGDACDADDDNDGDLDMSDCAPLDAAMFHGQNEVCNLVDDNCVNGVDEADAQGCMVYFQDLDSDGFGGSSACLCAPTAPFVLMAGGDCADDNPGIHAGVTEACNGLDDDCDGAIDPANSTGCQTLFADADGDGWGVEPATCLCSPAAPFTATQSGDCDDAHVASHPGLPEICDALDNDCDGATDPENTTGCVKYYKDQDHDGFGTTDAKCLCAPTDPYTTLDSTDCYDANADAKPGQTAFFGTHRGDGSFDYNCDGQQSRYYKGVGSCECRWDCGCNHQGGWYAWEPECGQTNSWITGCDRHCVLFCYRCDDEYTQLKQVCR